MTKEQKEKKYKLVEARELCRIDDATLYDNDVDVNPSEFAFIDENGVELDMIAYFEGTVILGMYESEDKLYVIIDIPSPPSSHTVELLVFERVE